MSVEHKLVELTRRFSDREFSARIPLPEESGALGELAAALNDLGNKLTQWSQAPGTYASGSYPSLPGLTDLDELDPRSQLPNEAGLAQLLLLEQHRGCRIGATLSVALCEPSFRADVEPLREDEEEFILTEIGRRLRRALRSDDHIGQLRDGRYLAILPNTREGEAVVVAERLRRAVEAWHISTGAQQMQPHLDVGTLPIVQKLCGIEELLPRLEVALRRGQYARHRMSEGGGKALPNLASFGRPESFRISTQSIRHLDDSKVVGYELLARAGTGVFSSPGAFFPLARECGVLEETDIACLKACVGEAAQRGLRGPVHLNMFPSTLAATDLDELLDLLKGDPELQHTRFCIELGHQQLVGDPLELVGKVEALKHEGILVALDGMGFGGKALESLLALQPDIVKLGTAFIRGIADDQARQRGLLRLFSAARFIGAQLIAVGIENEADRNWLLQQDIDYGQGYLWEAPS